MLQWKINVYELDPTIVKIASRYFGVIDDEQRQTHTRDGLKALQEAASHGTRTQYNKTSVQNASHAQMCSALRSALEEKRA